MPLSFPPSPTVGQISAQNGRTYVYTSLGTWELTGNVAGHAASHASGGGDALTLTASQISDFAASVAAASPAPIHPFLLMGG